MEILTNPCSYPMEAKNLTPEEVEAATPHKKPYRLADATVAGLMLSVHPSGIKYWRLQYSMPRSGETKVHSLGIYPEVSLAEARDEALAVQKRVQAGDDPDVSKRSRSSSRSSSRHSASFLGRWGSGFGKVLTSSSTSAFVIRSAWLGVLLTGFMVAGAWSYGTFLQHQADTREEALRAEVDQLNGKLVDVEQRLAALSRASNELQNKDSVTAQQARKAVDHVGEMAGMVVNLEERMGTLESQFPTLRKQLYGGIQKVDQVTQGLTVQQQRLGSVEDRFARIEDKVNEVSYWNRRGAFQ